MSKTPEALIKEAEVQIEIAERALDAPDNVRLRQEFSCGIGGNFRVEAISTHSSYNTGTPAEGDSRWMYLYGPHEPGRCEPIFSIDINKLLREGEVKGLTHQSSVLTEVLQQASDGTPEQRFLEVLKGILQPAITSGIRYTQLTELERLFVELIEPGLLVKIDSLFRKHQDGAGLGVRRWALTGLVELAGYFDLSEPRVKTTVCFPDQDHHLVLAQLRTGEYEQYEEPVDPLARHAAYADPEDIDRNKDGRVIRVSGRVQDLEVGTEAERVIGLRDLSEDGIAVVRSYISDCLTG